MRRLIVTMLSVLLLGALAPSAALAAKAPVPSILYIDVLSAGDSTPGVSCSVTVSVIYNTWRGVSLVQFDQNLDGTWNSNPTVTPARKATDASYVFNDLTYGSTIQYRVSLLDRSGIAPSPQTTGSYTFPAGSCPASGTRLAGFDNWT